MWGGASKTAGDGFSAERGCVLRSGATKNQPQRARRNRRAFFVTTLLRLVFDTVALRPETRVLSRHRRILPRALLQLLSKCWTIHLHYAIFSTEGQPPNLPYYHGVSGPNGATSIAPRRDGSPSRPPVVRAVAARCFSAARNPARSGQSTHPSRPM